MATRTIVTSQPDIACYVCERRLLRGEQPEVFLAAGRPRTVCELCAPRAAHAGWERESDHDSLKVPPLRARRGRNLLQRFRQPRRDAEASRRPATTTGPPAQGEPPEYEFLGGPSPGAGDSRQERARDRYASRPIERPRARSGLSPSEGPSGLAITDAAARGESPLGLLERAIGVFNAGDYPRRLAGLGRSLGVPEVSVRPVEGIPNVVTIVVAWELCWYEYRVDLDEDPSDARVLAQGTELSELAREDRLSNGDVDELGMLSLPAAETSAGA